jgi:3-hydroxymyristoyl/3-hydroxydecanoyl-(acyl carrier protein) dehydratase
MPVKVIRHRGTVWRFEGRAFVNDELCAEAEYSAMITDQTMDARSPSITSHDS